MDVQPESRIKEFLEIPLQQLEPGAVGEAVRQDDVLVEIVGTRGTVTFHLVDHLTDGQDGGGGGQRGGWLRLRGGRGRGDAFGAGLAGEAFICVAVSLGEGIECGFGLGGPVGGAGAK